MSISDGFHLWLGKELAELAIAGIVLAAVAIFFLGWAVVFTFANRKRRP